MEVQCGDFGQTSPLSGERRGLIFLNECFLHALLGNIQILTTVSRSFSFIQKQNGIVSVQR